MNELTVVDKAIGVALRAHNGQVNHHDGEPYLLHVHRVAVMVRDTGGSPLEVATAWLHDTLEDTFITIKDLAHFEEVADAVVAITKVKGESNIDYYSRVKLNPIATKVKLCDIHDNFGRNHLIIDEATKLRMAQKYSLGIDMLSRSH